MSAARSAKRKADKQAQREKRDKAAEKYVTLEVHGCAAADCDRAWEIVNQIEVQKWRPIPHVALLPPPTGPLPSVLYSTSQALPTPLELLRRFITVEMLRDLILPTLNGNLEKAKRDHQRSEPSLLTRLEEKEFWRFLAHYIAKNLETRKAVKVPDQPIVEKAKRLIGHNRFSALHARFLPNEQQLLAFVSAMRSSILAVIKPGVVVAIDDRIIAYFAQSMRDAGLAVSMPEKPHGYGQQMLVAAQKLPLCGLRVFLDVELRVATSMLSPSVATLALVERLRAHLPPQSVFVADSASLAKATLPAYLNCPVKFALSVKDRRAAYFQQFWSFAQEHLPKDHTRTYSNGDLILQLSDRDGDHTTSVLTNAFQVPHSPHPPPAPLCSYDLALAMMREPRATLNTVLKATPAEAVMTQIEMIKSRTNIDPSLPPDSSGALTHTSKAQLMQLKKDQLLARAAGIRGVTVGTNFSKEKLADLIMQREGHEQEDEGVGVLRKRHGMHLEQYQEHLRGEATLSCPVTNFWVEHYGDIDQLNRELYQLFVMTGSPTWEASIFWSLIATLILNAYAAYFEIRMQHAYNASGGNRAEVAAAEKKKSETTYSFALDLLRNLLAELER